MRAREIVGSWLRARRQKAAERELQASAASLGFEDTRGRAKITEDWLGRLSKEMLVYKFDLMEGAKVPLRGDHAAIFINRFTESSIVVRVRDGSVLGVDINTIPARNSFDLVDTSPLDQFAYKMELMQVGMTIERRADEDSRTPEFHARLCRDPAFIENALRSGVTQERIEEWHEKYPLPEHDRQVPGPR